MKSTYKKIRKSIRPIFLFIMLFCSYPISGSSQKIIRVPLERKLDKGVFSPRRSFGTFISDTKAFAFDSTNYSLYSVWKFSFDEMQYYYNRFLDKNRIDSNFIKLQKRYAWDTSQLRPGFNNDIYVFAGIRKDGKYIIIPDRNRNRLFSDDEANFYRLDKVPKDSLKMLTAVLPIIKLPLKIAYKGQLIDRIIAVQFYPKAYFGSLRVSYPSKAADSLVFAGSVLQYLEGKIGGENKKSTIVIRNAGSDIRYNNIENVEAFVLPASGRWSGEIDESLTYNLGDTLAVGSELYKFVNVDHLGAYIDISYVGKNKNIGIVPGSFAKYFSFKNITDKRSVSLDDYRGKYLLIDFWGTWCAPCKEILPDIKKMSTDYKGRNFKVLSIANDDNIALVAKFIQREGMDWDQHFIPFENAGKNNIINDYKVLSYPTTILIDPAGKILFRASNTQEFKAIKRFVEDLFK